MAWEANLKVAEFLPLNVNPFTLNHYHKLMLRAMSASVLSTTHTQKFEQKCLIK